MAETACTQALWKAVMGDNPAHFTDDLNNPVERVSWDDIQLFLQRADDFVPNMIFRLPSEAEWECACRAGSTSAFSFGHSITPNQANYDDSFGGMCEGECREKTIVVKSFSPNNWGLYQMHGNVWEWCQDTWDDYANTPMDGSAATGGESSRRVLRGGAWFDEFDWLRSAYRSFGRPSDRDFNFDKGFRLVCGLPFADG